MTAKRPDTALPAEPAALDLRLLAATALPLLLLALAAAALWAQLAAQDLRQQRAQTLAAAAQEAFAEPRDWASRESFRQALDRLNWQQAYLRQPDGSRAWQQDRGPAERRWPAAPRIELALDSANQLVLVGSPLTEADLRVVQTRALAALFAALLLTAVATWLSCRTIRRPQQRLLNWIRALETGDLTRDPPPLSGLSARIAGSVQILAQRLRFSRDTLQQQLGLPARYDGPAEEPLRHQLRDLEKEHERLQGLLAARSEMMAGMGHELRTPLTAIMGFSDLLEKGELTAEQTDYVQTIRKSAKGLVGLINDLLDFGRIEAGRLEIHEVGFDVGDSVEDTVALLAPLAYEKHLELISIVYHDVPLRQRGDPVRLQQILTNLISNAIKFTQQGQVLLRVMKQAEDGDRCWLKFQVEDSGVGLSEEQQAKLFTAFERFESGESPKAAGSGLGLTIVKQLTALLGGEVSVQSEAGRGSTFAVVLPFERERTPGPRANWDALRDIRCWVLEPHDLASLALHHLLEFWGLETRRFTSAGELHRTLAHARPQNRPDLVLLGLRADEVDEPVIAELLSLELPVPMVGLINSVDVAVHRRLREMGARAVLPKCANRTSLYRSCYELLARASPDPAQGPPLAGYRLLVAENNAASQRYLQALLHGLGAETLIADDGETALALWREHEPDIALLDLQMPRRDGRETAAAIRELAPDSRAVLIGMSAYLSPEQERDWRAAGVNSILTKPFDEGQLLRCLHPWLRSPPAAPAGAGRSPARRLVKDPELATMIVEELPRQLEELDQAFVDGDLESARAAAHQLHGTAAFFHLAPLKDHVFLLEKRLREAQSIGGQARLRDDMANVREAVTRVIENLEAQGR